MLPELKKLALSLERDKCRELESLVDEFQSLGIHERAKGFHNRTKLEKLQS